MPTVAYWLNLPQPRDPVWQLEAAGVTGTIAGFMLAALALIEATRQSERMKSVSETKVMNSLINVLLGSLWGWTIATALALAHWVTASSLGSPNAERVIWVLFLGGLAFSSVEGIRATTWVHAVFSRFRN